MVCLARLLLAAGLSFAGDAIEVTFLSFLSPCVQIEWGLSNFQSATIAGVVFFGEILGAGILGLLADVVGRKPMYFASCLLIFLAGLGSVFADGYA